MKSKSQLIWGGLTKTETKKRIPRPLKVIGIILTVMLVIVVVIAIFASINVKAMNNCIDTAIAAIRKEHQLTEIPEDEYGMVKLNFAMTFDVNHYRI